MSTPSPNATDNKALTDLRKRIGKIERPDWKSSRTFSTGCAALDQRLPRGGIVAGTLVEFLAAGPGNGAGMLSLIAARHVEQGFIVIVDLKQRFFVPAAVNIGIDAARLIVVRPSSKQDELWAIDQALRSPGIAVVWSELETIDPNEGRRLQLAAESGNTLGFFLRPACVRGRPSWADVQFLVEPCPSERNRRLGVEILRAKGGTAGPPVMLEIDSEDGNLYEARQYESHLVSSSSEMAAPTVAYGA